eukprot:s155_g31.t1
MADVTDVDLKTGDLLEKYPRNRNKHLKSGAVNEPLSLRFNNASLEAGKAYTVGVRVLNPGGPPLTDSNYWGISLQDHTRATFDANLRIPGLELKSIPITCNGTGWTNSDPRVLTIVLIQIRVLHEIPSGTLQRFVVRAPEGIMFNEDPAKACRWVWLW